MAVPSDKSRVIPIKLAAVGTAAIAEDLHKRLARDGWMRQMTIGEPRLSELVENYRKLGYEVRVELDQDAGEDCTDDEQEARQSMSTVYVRKAVSVRGSDEPS